MFQKILVPVDGSETMDRTVRLACDLAKMWGGTLTLIHVVALPIPIDASMPFDSTPLEHYGKKALETAQKLAEDKRLQGRYDSRGRLWERWPHNCKNSSGQRYLAHSDSCKRPQQDRDLADRKCLPYSGAWSFLPSIDCSTLVAKMCTGGIVGMTFQRVLVPVDDSRYTSEVAQQAIEFARKTGVTLTFLHVVNMPKTTSAEDIEQQKLACRRIPDGCRERAAAQDVSASSRIDVGSPVETIISMVEREKFDLIIMGSRGQSHLRTLLVGSVADQVMEHASCPVLLLK